MTDRHPPIDEFFIRLAELFESRKRENHGSIFLTQKRSAVSHVSTDHTATSSSADADDSFADLNPSSPMPILIRATNGKRKGKRKERVKITTIIQPEQLEGFFTRYAETCKAGMQGLKKRDRSGRKKAKAKKRKDTDVEKKA